MLCKAALQPATATEGPAGSWALVICKGITMADNVSPLYRSHNTSMPLISVHACGRMRCAMYKGSLSSSQSDLTKRRRHIGGKVPVCRSSAIVQVNWWQCVNDANVQVKCHCVCQALCKSMEQAVMLTHILS